MKFSSISSYTKKGNDRLLQMLMSDQKLFALLVYLYCNVPVPKRLLKNSNRPILYALTIIPATVIKVAMPTLVRRCFSGLKVRKVYCGLISMMAHTINVGANTVQKSQ